MNAIVATRLLIYGTLEKKMAEIRYDAVVKVKKRMKMVNFDREENGYSQGLDAKAPKKNKARQLRISESIWAVLNEQERKIRHHGELQLQLPLGLGDRVFLKKQACRGLPQFSDWPRQTPNLPRCGGLSNGYRLLDILQLTSFSFRFPPFGAPHPPFHRRSSTSVAADKHDLTIDETRHVTDCDSHNL